jgi:hypothetical protein
MAVQLIKNPKELIGTNAERIAMNTTELTPGSTFYTTDTKKVYIWDGLVWNEM